MLALAGVHALIAQAWECGKPRAVIKFYGICGFIARLKSMAAVNAKVALVRCVEAATFLGFIEL